MNMKNVEFLRDQIKYTGYGEGFEAELKEKIAKGLPEFQLHHRTEFNDKVVTASLEFSKSKNSDLYFFNSHKVEFKPEGSRELMSQTFRMGKENNTTLKEAFNLMEGRAIYKEFSKLEKQGEGQDAKFVATGEKYQAWKKFNFKESDKFGNFKADIFTDAYGYNLKEAIARLPLKEQQDEPKMNRLQASLEKGNLQIVEGKDQQFYLAANPQFKRIDVYDLDLKKISLDLEGQPAHSKSKGQENKPEAAHKSRGSRKKNSQAV